MNDYTKPPLGAPPAYIAAEARIKELADAISRASVEGRNYTGHITKWANEIIWQCGLMDKARIDAIEWPKDGNAGFALPVAKGSGKE